MRIAIGLILLVLFNDGSVAQELSYKAKDEIKSYKQELAKLSAEYEKSVMKLRADLDTKLSALSKEFVDKGNLDQARLVDKAKGEINPPTSIANRMALQQQLVGKSYRWRGKGGHVWKIESDSTIVSLNTGDIMPWVTLTENEILLIQSNKTLRVLRFNDDRSRWIPYYLPEPVIAGKHGGADLVD